MHITLKPDQAALIHAKLQSGQYQTIDDVIQAALHLLEERDTYEQWVIETRKKVDAAAVSLDRGEGVDGEEVVSLILDKFRQARETYG